MSTVQPDVLKTLRSNTLQKINQGKRRTHAVNVDFSEINESFTGRFVVHQPSQMELLQMGTLKSVLLGGNFNVDVVTDNIATIISTLDIVLDEFPEWFDVFDPEVEYEIIEAVFLEYIAWRDSFRKGSTDGQPAGDSPDK